MIKAVVFDFFDVIHDDPQKAWLKAHGFERSGIFAEASDKLDVGEIDLSEYYRLYAEGHGSKSVEDVRAEFAEIAQLDPDTVDVVNRLRNADYTTALVSNTTTEEIGPILEEHQLSPLFDRIIISSEVGIRKPDPEIFKLILSQLNIHPHEALFVDDTPHNVEAAMSVGMGGIVHTTANNLERQLSLAGVGV